MSLTNTKNTKGRYVRNNVKMTWFCTQTIPILISIYSSSFRICIAKKCPYKNLMTFGMKTPKSCKPTHND